MIKLFKTLSVGSKVYLRPQALTPTGAITYSDAENPSSAAPVKDETKRLRFSHHRTAFDVDIENLESHPWRTKNVDLSDYFNYGFTEATWQVNTAGNASQQTSITFLMLL